MVKGDEYEYNSTMLYVRDLDESVIDDDLYQHFNQFPGLVVCCEIAKHHKTHKSLGDGFVNYSNPQEAANAIKISNSTLLKNKPIRVQFSPCHQSTSESILFIKNLDKSVDKHILHHIFSNYGQILNIRVSTDASGQCSGYASVIIVLQLLRLPLSIYMVHSLTTRKLKFVQSGVTIQKNDPNLCVIFSSQSSASKFHLRKFFSKYGHIATVSETTHHKGDRFGLVTFVNPEDAAIAARDAPNHKFFNQNFELYGKYKDAPDRDQGFFTLVKSRVGGAYAVRECAGVRGGAHGVRHVAYPRITVTKFQWGAAGCGGVREGVREGVLRDSNGTSTGSGLVAFSTNKEASTALHAMNGRTILGKTLCITLEKKRKSRPKMHPIPMTAMTPALEEGRESRPETQPIPMTPQPALPLPMHPSLHMHPPGGFGLGFGPQMYPPGGFGFGLGFGQQMFYGQTPPALFPLEPGHWYQQQLIPGVRLPARAQIPNTSVPQLFTGMTPGTGSSMPNSSCKLHMENFYSRFDSTI
ncbi:hypothetical protein POM88_035424 [Heracleum sosnowskyi]|uniref:RRM domain-containing protein n=1 Tax=Heracleum sosnowskyi TaxID=360622 RepID=A0AAD8MDZ7_9APIA|nr:hypothetical protein POM88_035424 [Heracleum sosnowskyi]